MILEDKWSWKRFGMAVVIVIVTAAMTIFTLVLHGEATADWILLAISGFVFCVLFLLSLEWNRKVQGIFQEKANNFVRIGLAYVLCSALTVAMSFLPDYARPVMVLTVVMTMVSTPFCGLLAGCYCSVLLAFAGSGSTALAACYLFLSICGCIIAQYMQDSRNQLWSSWIILTVTFCLSALFSLLDKREFTLNTLEYSILSGVISCLGAALLFRLWNDKIITSRDDMLDRIIEERYELVQTMRNYSKADFEHARKVSRIARGCAKAIGADERLAAAAGFYYRIGRLEGEPYVENGLSLAKKNGFPPELIQILGEYNGEKYLPSTVESALVHIVDNVVAKFDVLDRTTLSSSWNQDIVVYQTLNENSAQGLYDQSGLSMNMFLIVRDYLIKEAGLYDDNH